MSNDFEYHVNKRPDRTYVSSPFLDPIGQERQLRVISKVFDTADSHTFATVNNELVIHESPGGRVEVKAFFYEDNREIQRLQILKFKGGSLDDKLQFTFQKEDIAKVFTVFRAARHLTLGQDDKERLDDDLLDDLLFDSAEKRRLFLNNLDLVEDIARHDITRSDIVALAYRKVQLSHFDRLLNDSDFFEECREQLRKGSRKASTEDVWQDFFERNTWILGYGLHYIFATPLDQKKLEQVTTGYQINQRGKRVDGLMKTRGLISSLCFVELKRHDTPLVDNKPYRPECWAISDELAGGVSQLQKTVHNAVKSITDKLESEDEFGRPTGEVAYLYQPRSVLVVGSLGQFVEDEGINSQQFSSFELFRRNLAAPEVITFDELYERARWIVQCSEGDDKAIQPQEDDPNDDPQDFAIGLGGDDGDIPF